MPLESGKFCPVCKHLNELGAMVCSTCGSLLESSQEEPLTTLRMNREQAETNISDEMTEETAQKAFSPPEEGIAIYLRDNPTPIAIPTEGEFLLGRLLTGELDKAFVDLKRYYGYENGVSRRHALIRRTDHGYEILDLGSTNGTYQNNQPLIPKQPYPLESGDRIRLGRMQLFVVFREDMGKP
jgi:hypothetical protein